MIFKDKKKLHLPLLFLFFCFLIAILLTGERSNSIKSIFIIILFLSTIDIVKLRIKILVLFILIGSIIFLIISNSNYLKIDITANLQGGFIEKDSKFFNQNTYIKLYRSGYEVFKNSPLFGVGNKTIE